MPQSRSSPMRAIELEDLVPKDREPPRVHPRRLVVLVDEALEVGERTVGLGAGEGRGQVVDDDRLRAALRLGPFARIVDDERVDVRHRAKGGLRKARGGEGEGLAGEPFEVPVLAHVNDGVHPRPRPEPGVEGEVAVRGHEVGVVVGGGGIDVVAPRRLEPDDGVAEAYRGYREACARARAVAGASTGAIFRTRAPDRTGTRPQTRARIDSHARAPATGRICAPGRTRARAESRALAGAGVGASADTGTGGVALALRCPGQEVRVTLGLPPSLPHRLTYRRRQGGEEREVVVEGEPLPDRAPRDPRVRRAGRDRRDEGVPVLGDAVHVVARGGHRPEELHGPRRGVEPDPVAEPPVPVRVVREHDGDPPLGGRGGGEVDPRPREVRGERHPVAPRDVGDDRALGALVEPGLRLERHRAGEDPPVHLGERDVHRDVARGEPLGPALPVLLAPPREHHLEHRPAARVEGGRAPLGRARRRDREPGRVQHEAHPRVREHGGDEVRGDRVLEARHVERERVHPARAKGVHESVDGGEVRRLDVRAVEDDGGGGSALDPPGGHLVEAARPALRVVEPGPGERRGLAPLGRVPDEVGREGEEVPGVRGPAVHAVLPKPMGALGRNRAEGGKLGVRLVVARKEGEGDRPGPARLDELLHPVGPVAGAPQHPGDDEPRARDHRLDVEVHRHRVGELHEVREAERREVVAEAGPRPREARELGVRGGEEDDVAPGLAQVDRLRLVDRRTRLRAQQVHRCVRSLPQPDSARPGSARFRPARRDPVQYSSWIRTMISLRPRGSRAARLPGARASCPRGRWAASGSSRAGSPRSREATDSKLSLARYSRYGLAWPDPACLGSGRIDSLRTPFSRPGAPRGCAARRAPSPRSPRAATGAPRRPATRGRSSAGRARRPPARGGACPCPPPPRSP